METRRKIEVTTEVRKQLMRTFGCSAMNVSRALAYQSDSDECRRLRRAALEKGGRVMNWLPECETLHCADGTMRQTFENGATITVNWAEHRIKVTDRKGDEISLGNTAVKTMDDFYKLQAWAEAL